MNTKPSVLLKRQANLVDVSPVAGITFDNLYQLLRSHLKYSLRIRNDARTARITGHKFRSEPRYLCRADKSKTHAGVLFPAGLLSRVARIFAGCEIDFTITDLRPTLLPAPRLDLLEHDKLKDRDDQRKCLAAIFSSDMGVIEAPTGFGKTFAMEQLVRAYPTVPIIVCSYRNDVVASIHQRMRRHIMHGDLGRVGGGHRDPRRVTIASIGSLEHAPLDKCRLLIYDEVHEAGSEDRSKKIAQVRQSRMFGFSASPRGRSDGSDLVIEAMFGPIIYRQTYQESEARGNVATINVEMHRVGGSPIHVKNDVARFRQGIWRNQLRNHILAKHAAKHSLDGKQVLIAVDKVEHALFIKRHFLPDWPVVHGTVGNEQIETFKRLDLLPNGSSDLCTEEKRASYLRRFEVGVMKRAIATGVWSVGVDFKCLDVLVRGDGQSAPIKNTQLPGRLSRGEVGLLIDCHDQFDEGFRRASEDRARSYRSKGWDVNII